MTKLQHCGIVLSSDLQNVVGAFHVAKAWVTEWPLTKRRSGSIEDALFAVQHGYVAPAQDADFLRKASIISCGSLSMVLNLMWHEIGLSELNTSPHVFAICHLYNGLKKTNRLKGG